MNEGQVAGNSAYKLSRLILIDSYKRSAKIEIKLDGHTSFNGPNGAGKTSLLRLIPLFYGESPSKIVQGGGVIQSFLQHYLPRLTSYIIFEYTRRGLPCMVAIHASKSGENTCYRFIDKPFELDRFIDENGDIVIGPDLLRHLAKRDESCSEQISVLSDYRSIIQNTVSKREHRPLASRFAFVGSGARLGHIEKIATGMFSRVTNFRDLRRMIVSCIEDDTQSIRLQASRGTMESWVKEYRAYQSVMAHAGRMGVLNEAFLAHEETGRMLRAVHGEFILLRREQETDIQRLTATIEKLDNDMRAADEKNQRLLTDLTLKSVEAQSLVKERSEKLKALDHRHAAYERSKITELASLIEQIPELEHDLRDLKDRQDALLGQSSNIQNDYDKLKNERTAHANRQIDEKQRDKEPIREKSESDRQNVGTEYAQAWLAKETLFDERETKLQAEIEEQTERVGSLKTTAASPQASASHREAEQQARANRDAVREHRLKAQQDDAEAEKAYGDEVTHYEDIDRKVQELRRRLESEKQNTAHLLTLANAAPGTLLHFLREHRPQWTEDIARVVPEELLLRTDLAPSLPDDGAGSLYGVSLDLTVIDRARAADEAALQEQIALSNHATELRRSEIKTAETDLATQSKRLDDARARNDLMNVARIQALAKEKEAESALEVADRALKEEVRQAKKRAEHELQVEQRRLEQNRTALKAFKSDKAEEKAQHDTKLKSALQAISDQAKEAIGAIDKEIDKIRVRHARDMQEIDWELASALSGAGVDTDSLNTLKSRMTPIETNLERARRGVSEVNGWKEWELAQWLQRPALVEALSQAQAEAGRLAGAKMDAEQAGIKRRTEINSEIESTTKQRRQAETMMSFVDKRRARLTSWAIQDGDMARLSGPPRSQELLETEMDRLLKEAESTREHAREEVDVLKRAMYEHPGTAPYSFYEKKRLELGPDMESGSPFAWVPAMREWFEIAGVEARRLLNSQSRTFAQNISEFRERLERFNRQVGVFSRDLQDKMTASIQFRQINGIAVRLTTSFDSLEGWGRIKDMADAYASWAGLDTNELPPNEFTTAVDQVNSYLQGRHTVEVKLEDLIGIEIDIDETGQPRKTVKDESQLKDASSNGLSYLILCVVFVGLINKIRGKEAVTMVWALDELRDLDIGNVQSLLDMLTRNAIHLVSAYPDPDPDILSLFKNRYEVLEGRKIATFRIPEEAAHV